MLPRVINLLANARIMNFGFFILAKTLPHLCKS